MVAKRNNPGKVIYWGVIGTGRIAHDFTTALKASTRGRVWAVASRQIESSKSFAKDFNIPNAYGTYEELFDDPSIGLID